MRFRGFRMRKSWWACGQYLADCPLSIAPCNANKGFRLHRPTLYEHPKMANGLPGRFHPVYYKDVVACRPPVISRKFHFLRRFFKQLGECVLSPS